MGMQDTATVGRPLSPEMCQEKLEKQHYFSGWAARSPRTLDSNSLGFHQVPGCLAGSPSDERKAFGWHRRHLKPPASLESRHRAAVLGEPHPRAFGVGPSLARMLRLTRPECWERTQLGRSCPAAPFLLKGVEVALRKARSCLQTLLSRTHLPGPSFHPVWGPPSFMYF